MPLIARFEDIRAWQQARVLNQQIYRLTSSGALAKDFEVRSQIRGASVSMMTNIAEGFDCDSHAEFARFLGIARRSAVEVQSLLYTSLDAGYITDETLKVHYNQAAKTIALINALKKSLKP
jgi:four helix bundle protein